MRVALTGANGYLGRHFDRHFTACGVDVLRLARTATGERTTRWQLGDRPDLRGIDVLVHCAHSFDRNDVNLEGTRCLFDSAVQAGVSRIVYVSSLAAFDGCRSEYGRTKRAIELETARLGGVSVRPGTVWGGDEGGPMRSLERLVERLPVVPSFGRSVQLRLVQVDDLSAVMSKVIDTATSGPLGGAVLGVAHPQAISFGELLSGIAKRRGRQRLLLPVPALAAEHVLRLLERLGIRLPLRSDSIASLRHPNPSPDLSLPSSWSVRLRAYARGGDDA